MLELSYPVLTPDADINMMAWGGNYDDIFSKLQSWGYGKVELLVRDAYTVNVELLTEKLQEYKLGIAQIATGPMQRLDHIFLMSPDPVIRKKAVNQLEGLIELGSKFKAPVVIAKFRGQTGDVTGCRLDDLASLLHSAEEAAFSSGIELLIEPQSAPGINNLNGIEESVQWIEDNGLKYTKLLMDTFHMGVTEHDVVESMKMYSTYLGGIHLADTERRIPGLGALDFSAILETLASLRFQGPVSMEVKQIPDSATAAFLSCRAIRYLERWNKAISV